MAVVQSGCTLTLPRWFDDFETRMQNMQKTFLKRSFSDCGMEIPFRIPNERTNSWKLLDNIHPFRPEEIQITVAEDGKSIILEAKSDRTASDGGKISHAISKRWAWTEDIDVSNLTCFIEGGTLFIEATDKDATLMSSATAGSGMARSGALLVPMQKVKSTQIIDVAKTYDSESIVKSSAVKELDAEAASRLDTTNKTDPLREQAIRKEKELESEAKAGSEDVKEHSSTVALHKVQTGAVANARRLFQELVDKERAVDIKKLNASVSEQKLKSKAEKRSEQFISETAKTQDEKGRGSPVRPTDLSIALDGKTDSSLLSVDIDGYLNLFDDDLLSLERQFWENRVSAFRQMKVASEKFHSEFLQNLHWPSIFEDSRILRSNFNDVTKGLDVKENEVNANEFKVALDVAGCLVENLSVRVSDSTRLIVEAQWRDGFTDRVARREWILPQVISDSDVKCTMSSDNILVITVNFRPPTEEKNVSH